ncbi:MAG: ATP-binding cassette domain-containing protein [Chitinophagaceae bacterium]|nr:ATP-binding cassette domain-containing protein [Chitinophagaceae bacterium]
MINVEKISKKFVLSHESKERYTALRDVVSQKVKNAVRGQFFKKDKGTKEEFWALQDVSFTVNQGDRVGIIGRNGAGKSTLLKILSRISDPTEGRITIRGRVASLLEVGTGFHPELTGRENIFLNGAILGMSRAEIRSKFDEIVDFAEVEKFLDTPVKRYSSGMYVRLAFAVAAHMEPEILIVDEVLAVGDAQFQKKCLGKMQDVSKNEGRTVLFVSHNIQAISNLCNRGIYLANGKIVMHNAIDATIEKYLHAGEAFSSSNDLAKRIAQSPSDPDFKLIDVAVIQDNREVVGHVVNGKELEIKLTYDLPNRVTGFRAFLDFCDDMGVTIFRTFHDEDREGIMSLEAGRYVSKIIIPPNILAPIIYDIKLLFGIHTIRMLPPHELVIRINVEQTGDYNKSYSGQFTGGKVCLSLPWTINKI